DPRVPLVADAEEEPGSILLVDNGEAARLERTGRGLRRRVRRPDPEHDQEHDAQQPAGSHDEDAALNPLQAVGQFMDLVTVHANPPGRSTSPLRSERDSTLRTRPAKGVRTPCPWAFPGGGARFFSSSFRRRARIRFHTGPPHALPGERGAMM